MAQHVGFVVFEELGTFQLLNLPWPVVSAPLPQGREYVPFDTSLLGFGSFSWSGAFPLSMAFPGVYAPGSPLEYVFGHIYIMPDHIDVGNLTGAIKRTITLWNAYFISKSCVEVKLGGMDGITVEPLYQSFVMGPLESIIFSLTFEMDGPPVINAEFGFDFGSEEVHAATFAGRRIVAWVWRSQAPMLETLEWLTDVIASRSGKEQRARLRNSPRQAFLINALTVRDSESAAIETSIYGWQARSWALPVWSEYVAHDTPLPVGSTSIDIDTRFSDFRPTGLLMLWQSPQVNETVQISSVSDTRIEFVLPTSVGFAGGFGVYPVRTVRMLGSAKRNDFLAGASRFECNFLVIDNIELPGGTPPILYKDAEVLLDKVMYGEADSIARVIDRPMTVIDYNVGTATIDVPRAYSTGTYEMRWKVQSPQQAWEMRKWFHRRSGRLVPFWAPSWRSDLILVNTIAEEDSTFRVVDVAYSRLLHDYPTRKHIFVELIDGSHFFFEVLGAVIGNPGEDILTIDGTFGRVVTPADVQRMSWLSLFRLDADKVEFNWDEVGAFTVAVPIKEIER